MPLDFRQIARENARRSGINESVFERQIDEESRFNPDAHNAGSGADGIAQIVVSQHPSMAGKTRDPVASLQYAAQYDRSNLNRYNGDVRKMLAAYNWGPGRVDRWNGQRSSLPAETRGYLDDILGADWVPNSGDEPQIGSGQGGGSGEGGGGSVDPGVVLEWFRSATGENGWSWADVGWSIAFGAAGVWLIMNGIVLLGQATYRSPLMAAPVAATKWGVKAAKTVPQIRAANAVTSLAQQAAGGGGTLTVTTPKPVKAVLGQGATRPSGALGTAAKAIKSQAQSTAADAASGALANGVIAA